LASSSWSFVILLWLKNQKQEQEQKLVGSGCCHMTALGGELVCLLHELSPNQPHVQLVLVWLHPFLSLCFLGLISCVNPDLNEVLLLWIEVDAHTPHEFKFSKHLVATEILGNPQIHHRPCRRS
jgi:hypothetical protein